MTKSENSPIIEAAAQIEYLEQELQEALNARDYLQRGNIHFARVDVIFQGRFHIPAAQALALADEAIIRLKGQIEEKKRELNALTHGAD